MTDFNLETLDSSAPLRLAVVGDVMLDRTRWVTGVENGDLRTNVWQQQGTTDQPGGAAYVAQLLESFGAEVDVYSVVGADAEGASLQRMLRSEQTQVFVPIDTSRPTTLKERLVHGTPADPQRLHRIDRESTQLISADVENRLWSHFAEHADNYQGMLVSDYAKGVCTEPLMKAMITEARRRGIIVVVDPARRSSGRRFEGCDVLTPNRFEAESLTGIAVTSIEAARRAGAEICRILGAGSCVVTLDADGLVLAAANGESRHLESSADAVVDPTGAGDAFASSLLVELARGASMWDATRQASSVAGHQVARFGTTALPQSSQSQTGLRAMELRASLPVSDLVTESTRLERGRAAVAKQRHISTLADEVKLLKASGRRIVLTNGCFDLLHPGHVGYLEQAASEGDCLIVALNADQTVRDLKGSRRPVMSSDERACMLAALECVDFVVVFDEATPHEVIRQIRPDVLVKGGDYAVEDVVGRELVQAYGGKVKVLGLTPGLSTSNILERLGVMRPRLSDTA